MKKFFLSRNVISNMLVLLLGFLLFANVGHALQCIDNCIESRRFYQPFDIPIDGCKERKSSSQCFTRTGFDYGTRTYTVDFSNYWYYSSDQIVIGSRPYLMYYITYGCSKNIYCALNYTQSRLDEMF